MQKIAAFLGAGGSGKSTHAIYARDIFQLQKPINYTTREKRNEKDTDYIHVTIPRFHEKLLNHELFNAINFDGNLYGFDNKNITKTKELIICITPQALGYIKEYTEQTKAKLLTIFFATPEDELRRRILKRGVSKEETEQRIITDQIEMINRPEEYDHTIDTNKSLEDVRIDLMPILQRFFSR